MAVTYPSGEDKISWFDGTAVTITDALLQFCGRMELDTQSHLFGLGSDGGSVS